MNNKNMEKYNNIKSQLRKYSFQHLKVSEEPVIMLEYLKEEFPEVIEGAQNPNLLSAAIVSMYIKQEGLGGRGGITAKQIGEYFSVSASSISQKVYEIDYIFDEHIEDEIFAIESERDDLLKSIDGDEVFIDIDRFKVAEIYWDFLESAAADDTEESIVALKKIIKKDPDYFDPYISLYECYMDMHDTKNAVEILQQGYRRSMDLIAAEGIFPEELSWGYMENRHIIRLLFNMATMLWATGIVLSALSIFLQLLRSNPKDNIGARYAAVALLEGYKTYEHFEMEFEEKGVFDMESMESWFRTSVVKHQEFMGSWLDFAEGDYDMY